MSLPAPPFPQRQPSTPRRLLPLALFLLAILWLLPLHGDLWIADKLYAWQGHAWTLRRNFVTDALIHGVGKRISVLAWLGVAIMYAASWKLARLRAWRQPLLYLLVSVALGTGLVSALKHITDIDCPWDIDRYGGLRPYINLLGARPPGLPRGLCFPAGHASAGYAWVALYFFFAAVRPAWRVPGLVVGLAVGALFGFSQQLRGAHFMSHDLFTLAICWCVATGSCRLLLPASRRAAVETQPALARSEGAAA